MFVCVQQAKLDKSKIDAYSKKAARSAAEFNASLMKDKKEERKAYFDLQTYVSSTFVLIFHL